MPKYKLVFAVIKLLCALSFLVLLIRIDDSEISKGGRAMATIWGMFMLIDGISSYSTYMGARKS